MAQALCIDYFTVMQPRRTQTQWHKHTECKCSDNMQSTIDIARVYCCAQVPQLKQSQRQCASKRQSRLHHPVGSPAPQRHPVTTLLLLALSQCRRWSSPGGSSRMSSPLGWWLQPGLLWQPRRQVSCCFRQQHQSCVCLFLLWPSATVLLKSCICESAGSCQLLSPNSWHRASL